MASRLAWLAGIAWLYVVARGVSALPGGVGVRIAVAAVLLVVAEHHAWSSRWFGSMASPELPRAVLVFLNWAFAALVFLALLLLLHDCAGGVASLFSRSLGEQVFASGVVLAAPAALAAVVSAYGVARAIGVPAVKRVRVQVSGLPEAFDGYRIVQLSDLHVGRLLTGAWLAAVVARANAQDADLMVITGDLADGKPTARAVAVQAFAALHAPDGVVAIPGNHEYYSDYVGWMVAYRGLGLHMLANAHVLIRRGAATLAVAGVTDGQAAAFGEPVPDLATALRGVPPGIPIVLLQHRPGDAPGNARAGVALQLSGHTHGGQIRGLDALVRRANGGFVSGQYRVGAMKLYVSNGTGLWAGFALRLGRAAEITELVLTANRDHRDWRRV